MSKSHKEVEITRRRKLIKPEMRDSAIFAISGNVEKNVHSV